MTSRGKKQLLAFCRLILRFEREVVTSVHMIFEESENVTWKFLIDLYGHWKGVRVEEKQFPSFLLNAWNTLRGESPSFTTFQVGQEEQEAVGQRYVGNDFWVFTEEQTGINWRDAFDPCPRGSVWKDGHSYDWPGGLV